MTEVKPTQEIAPEPPLFFRQGRYRFWFYCIHPWYAVLKKNLKCKLCTKSSLYYWLQTDAHGRPLAEVCVCQDHTVELMHRLRTRQVVPAKRELRTLETRDRGQRRQR
jgi:hypothetical protein